MQHILYLIGYLKKIRHFISSTISISTLTYNANFPYMSRRQKDSSTLKA